MITHVQGQNEKALIAYFCGLPHFDFIDLWSS